MFIAYAGGLAIASLVLLVDLFIAALAITTLVLSVALVRHPRQVTGHVVRIAPAPPAARVPRRTRVRVAYDTPSGTLETGGTMPRPRIGAPMAVRYDPARPHRATTMVRPMRLALVQLPLVLAIAVLAIGVITGSAWYFAGIHDNAQAPLVGGCTALAIALGSGYYASGRYAVLARWRRHMTQAQGTVRRLDEHASVGGPGIQVSFKTASGREDFWAPAGSVPATVGDAVTVYYDPAHPADSATVQTTSDIRVRAIAATACALVFLLLAVVALASI